MNLRALLKSSLSGSAVASADGAIGLKSGTVFVTKAGVCAMTLADPVATLDDGKTLSVVSVTANAHTLSNAAGSGFNGGGAASDVGTFGGAKGDNIRVVAYQGVWYVERTVNVTLG
jgi:hypothetical protein